jgi:hypothetical protein
MCSRPVYESNPDKKHDKGGSFMKKRWSVAFTLVLILSITFSGSLFAFQDIASDPNKEESILRTTLGMHKRS